MKGPSMSTTTEQRKAFRHLHASGCFALPNPWDGGSAVRFAKAGFKALASTSAGAAWAMGKEDGEMSLDDVLGHLRFLCGVTDLPVNADFENGFSDTPEGVAENVARCIETGVAGLSIEDGYRAKLYPVEAAAERIRAARSAIDRSGEDVMLVGRCEAYLMDPLDLDAVISRLVAYGEAGADCLYAPGLKDIESIARVVRAVGLPVNANLTGTGLSVDEMAAAGVRRVSVGAALAKASYACVDDMVERLQTEGRLP